MCECVCARVSLNMRRFLKPRLPSWTTTHSRRFFSCSLDMSSLLAATSWLCNKTETPTDPQQGLMCWTVQKALLPVRLCIRICVWYFVCAGNHFCLHCAKIWRMKDIRSIIRHTDDGCNEPAITLRLASLTSDASRLLPELLWCFNHEFLHKVIK